MIFPAYNSITAELCECCERTRMNQFTPPKRAIPPHLMLRLEIHVTPMVVYQARMMNASFVKAQRINEIKHKAAKTLIDVYVVQLRRIHKLTLLKQTIQKRQKEAQKRRAAVQYAKLEKLQKYCAKADLATARHEAEQMAHRQFLLSKIKHQQQRADANRRRIMHSKLEGIQKFSHFDRKTRHYMTDAQA